MLFIRGDEAEESWRIIDFIAAAWKRGDVPLDEHPAGGRPPPGSLQVCWTRRLVDPKHRRERG